MLKLYDSVRLKTGQRAVIIEIFDKDKGVYLADIDIDVMEWDTDVIYDKDIDHTIISWRDDSIVEFES